MAEGFRCVVATPTRELFAGTVYYADVPGSDGHYGVLSGHESLVALNHRGGKLTLHLDPDGNEKKVFLIHCGCTQMLHNHLSVLGRFGCDPDDIDVAEIKGKADELRKVVEASFPTETYLPETDGADWDAAYARYIKLFG